MLPPATFLGAEGYVVTRVDVSQVQLPWRSRFIAPQCTTRSLFPSSQCDCLATYLTVQHSGCLHNTMARKLMPNKEALRLYREVLRTASAFTWTNEAGEQWHAQLTRTTPSTSTHTNQSQLS